MENEKLQELLRLLNGPHLCMTYFADSIQKICDESKPLSCETLFGLMGMDCPIQLKPYGWNATHTYDLAGYFYLYSDDDKTYYMGFPPLERMEE